MTTNYSAKIYLVNLQAFIETDEMLGEYIQYIWRRFWKLLKNVGSEKKGSELVEEKGVGLFRSAAQFCVNTSVRWSAAQHSTIHRFHDDK